MPVLSPVDSVVLPSVGGSVSVCELVSGLVLSSSSVGVNSGESGLLVAVSSSSAWRFLGCRSELADRLEERRASILVGYGFASLGFTSARCSF